MRLLCLLLCLGSQLALAASEQGAPGVPQSTGGDAEEMEFSDPFAGREQEAQAASTIPDPLERMNRMFFRFNDKVYFWVLEPTAKAYCRVAPEPFRASVRRFFLNVKYPIRGANNLLQGKFRGAGIETARFVVNSTVGLAGFFDPAHSKLRLEAHPEDFDQTLGFYRIGQGIYLHWPIFGPSSIRGTVGQVGDHFLTPWTYVNGIEVSLTVRPYETINATSLQLGDYESFKEAALDPYLSMRSAYLENRRSAVQQ